MPNIPNVTPLDPGFVALAMAARGEGYRFLDQTSDARRALPAASHGRMKAAVRWASGERTIRNGAPAGSSALPRKFISFGGPRENVVKPFTGTEFTIVQSGFEKRDLTAAAHQM